ncbi:MAG: hypothetical protein QOI82_3454 [Actinomycetota bacterium]|nr:hypothetical protein [Actinomycetota bacterium]
MTTSSLPRRAIVGAVLATALIGAGVAAFADDAAPADGCPTWTDPKGDSNSLGEPTGTFDDANLDIVNTSVTTTADKVIVAITTDGMTAGPSDAGDEFGLNLTAAGASLFIAADREVDGSSSAHVGSYADPSVSEAATAVFDVKSKTVTITAPVASIKAAAGADPVGKPATALSAYTADIVPAADIGLLVYDDSASKSTVTVGADCGTGGGDTPAAPVPVPSASPSTEPTPAPSAPPATGGAPAAGAPQANCFATKDPAGDAWYPANVVPNDADLDLLGVTLGTTSDALVAYFKVAKLADGPATLDGHRFTLNFTFNKHAFAAAGSNFKDAQAGQIRDGAASTGRFGHLTQLSVDGSSIPPTSAGAAQTVATGSAFVASGLKYTFDTKTSTVSLSLPLADIEKYGQAPTAGAALTGVYVSAATDTGLLSSTWDTAPDGASSSAPGKLTYAFGDNHCFAPPTPPLSSVGAVNAQYGDVASVAAKLVDGAGAPVAGKSVTFTLGASKATGVTGADGVAKGVLVVKELAGERSLVISSGDATTSVHFTVLVEKTVLKAVNNKGAATATLTDDDRQPVAGQVITFASGSKKVSAKTDANGVAKASGLPAGNVKVAYAGAAGKYTAASTTTKG